MDNESIEPYTTMTRKSSKTKSHYCQESSHRKSFHHINRKNLISRSHCFFGSVLAVIHKQYALISHDSELLLVSLPAAIGLLESILFESQASLRKLRSKPLLIPACVKISSPERYFLKSNTKLLSKIGINLILESNYVKLLKVPYILIEQSLYDFVPKLVQFLQVQGKDTIKMTDWLIRGSSKVSSDWSLRQATLLLTELDRLRPNLIASGLSNLVQIVMIEETIKALHPA